MITNKELAIKLASCESENEVISILKEYNYWENEKNWRPFGDNENNWSTIGNQQSDASAALVEKIVNSIDALLMKECLIRGISPESEEAPKSISEALEEYFNIKKGRIEDLVPSKRTELAKKIILAASGSKPTKGDSVNKYPNLTIVDEGEGQSPKRMPDTILSINKSNKLKVPFVQGKFNMGGTGVLGFCGEHNIQLIISKRCPKINNPNDETHSLWGFTVIRRLRPKDGRRSSMLQYLVNTDNNILSFDAENLPIIPKSEHENLNMKYGMYCKLFEYHLQSGLCSNINMRLNSRLSMLLPNLAYPIYLDECRDYGGHSRFRTLSGLNVRLSDNSMKEDNSIDEKLSASFTIDGQELSAAVYVFKTEKDAEAYVRNEGVLFTQNGQTHGHLDKSFYRRNSVNLSYLSKCLLTIVDCSKIDESTREDLFMNSRDRMRNGEFSVKLEKELEDYLKNNETLRALQAKRREQALSNKLDDEKPLEDVLNSVFKSSSVLSKLFLSGERLNNPKNLGPATEEEQFNGKYNPTFFALVSKKKQTPYTKECQLGRKFRIKFKTDANNDFFSREDYPGEYILECDGNVCRNHNMNLHNGNATLTVELPKDAQVGERYSYKCTIIDTNIEKEFINEFVVLVEEYKESGGNGGNRQPPSERNKDGSLLAPTGISLPKVKDVYQDEWNEYQFDSSSALKIITADADKKIYDFFVNMDNIHLLSELKPIAKSESKIKLLKARYIYSMVLIGLSVLGYHNDNKNINEEISIEESVEQITKMISPVILPMIEVMGSSDLTDIIGD